MLAGTTSGNIGVARFANGGTADGGFGVSGLQTVDFGLQDEGQGLVIQPDGNIVVAGIADAGVSSSDFALARLLGTNGALDTTFGGGSGKLRTDISGNVDEAHAVALQPTTTSLVSGWGTFTGTQQDFVTVRYNTVADNSHIYVNDTWVKAVGAGSPNTGDLVTNSGFNDVNAPGTIFATFNINSFTTVAGGITAVDSGGTVTVVDGQYLENVLINKSMILEGQNEPTRSFAPRRPILRLATPAERTASSVPRRTTSRSAR